MNHLEQYIRKNKSQFDEEPETGHFERMQQKINRIHHKTIMMRWSVSAAASVIVLLSIGVLWLYTGKTDPVIMMCENTDDMKRCYLNKMNDMAGQIEELTRDFDQWDQQQVMSDVQNIIDTVNSDFENEIPEELPDEATKSILADYYRQNLESLKMIKQKVKSEE